MNIDRFIKENNIALFVEGDLKKNKFNIINTEIPLESYVLYEQLILNSTPENLSKYLSGQLLPRIWKQGNVKCILCKPDPERIFALFCNKQSNDPKEEYLHAKELDLKLKEII